MNEVSIIKKNTKLHKIIKMALLMSIFYLHIQCIGYAASTNAPIFSLPEGQYYNVQSKDVSISCGTIGATIYYTTDGSNPTTSSLV